MIKQASRAAVILAASIAAFLSAPLKASEGLDVTLTPYLWAAGIDGKIDFGAQSAQFDASFSDLLTHLNGGFETILEVNKGRWVNWAQLDYLALENNRSSVGAINSRIESNVTMLGIGTGYRFDTSERSTLDVLLGMRYLGLDNQLRISGVGSRKSHDNTTDALLTLRPHLRVRDKWTLSPTISIGTGDSDLVWELSPQVEYTISDRFDVRFGYRQLHYKFKDGSNQLDFAMKGFMVGAGISF